MSPCGDMEGRYMWGGGHPRAWEQPTLFSEEVLSRFPVSPQNDLKSLARSMSLNSEWV
jgi:hypothetical protein